LACNRFDIELDELDVMPALVSSCVINVEELAHALVQPAPRQAVAGVAGHDEGEQWRVQVCWDQGLQPSISETDKGFCWHFTERAEQDQPGCDEHLAKG